MEANNILIVVTVFLPLMGGVLSLFLWGRDRLQRYLGFGIGVLAWLASLGVMFSALQDGPQVYRLGGLAASVRHRPGGRCLIDDHGRDVQHGPDDGFAVCRRLP
ncbi:hypothetical protein QPK87_33430 [Kamptonema cortianum]|nr:hypothetical protein [Kamptonema cortianum]